MADSERGRSFNNIVSGIAAIAGTIGLVVATITSNEVNKLSQQSRTAGLVGDLTDKLTSKELGRDISLLAIEHMLNTEPGKEKAPRDKLLLARISILLIEGSSGEESINAQNNNSRQASATQTQFNHGVDQAARVLNRLVQSSGESCNSHYKQQIFNLNLKLSGNNLTTAAAIEADCGEAGSLAIEALGKQVEGKDSNGEQAVSVSQLAQDAITDPKRVAISLAQARVVNQLNAFRLEAAHAESPYTESSLAIVTVHLDDPALADQLEPLLLQLSAKRWYIVSGVRIVEPSARSCGQYNSVRFFHKGDIDLAKKLIAQIDTLKPSATPVRALVEGSGNTRPGILPIDLSTWKYSRSVPQGTVELWLASKGSSCQSAAIST
ncbi:hypothetical protein [Cyanobium gracile]|uniref:Uncharacterized protein n=1 Tax=Cyanobium gracile UHCC 0281 TaxID=3110309 RepID=A0ABU5SUV1_9CYAN|nr:hypothetical protein [Cyanobium gracile]MEA5442290.1 hypothetical protein [Cyanobium gracile UHCC 0281]